MTRNAVLGFLVGALFVPLSAARAQPEGPPTDAPEEPAVADPAPGDAAAPTPEPAGETVEPAPPAPPEPAGETVERAPDVDADADEAGPPDAHLFEPRPINLGRFAYLPGSGIDFRSEDGDFRLKFQLRIQTEYTAQSTDTGWHQRFRIRRARLKLNATAFSPDVRMKLELAFSPNDAGMRDEFVQDGPRRTPILDAYLGFYQLRDLRVRLGQMKTPTNRQRVTSSADLQIVDRSILNSEFTLDRDVGLDLSSDDLFGLDLLRYRAAIMIGRGRDSQGFDDFGMLYALRLEVHPFGTFDDDSGEADFERAGPRLALAGGYAYLDRARGDRGIRGNDPADGGTTDMHFVYADLLFYAYGLSVLFEFALRDGQRNPGDAVDEMGNAIPVAAARDGWGVHLQAGYLLPDLPVEIAARYARIRPRGDASALGPREELTGGLNVYFGRSAYKVQLDYGYLWRDQRSEGIHQVRALVQVSF